jgi:hypothetical protein
MKFLVVLVVAAVGVAGSSPSGLAALLSKHDMDPVKSHFQLGRLLRAPSSTHVQAKRVGGQPPCAQAPNLTPAPATLPNVTVAALQALEESVQELLATAQATGGHATLVYDQAVLWSTNFGTTLAGGQGANVTQDTVFRIGSITKVCKLFPVVGMEVDGRGEGARGVAGTAWQPRYSKSDVVYPLSRFSRT